MGLRGGRTSPSRAEPCQPLHANIKRIPHSPFTLPHTHFGVRRLAAAFRLIMGSKPGKLRLSHTIALLGGFPAFSSSPPQVPRALIRTIHLGELFRHSPHLYSFDHVARVCYVAFVGKNLVFVRG